MKRTLAAVLLASTTTAQAAFYSGNDLYDWLSGNAQHGTLRGMLYVAGVVDTLNDDVLCLPGNVTLGQVRDVVMYELRTNPSMRHLAADVLVRMALEPIWACKRRNPGRPT